MSKIELDVLFKKMQKDDKKEVLEFHILGDEIPHKTELMEMAGGIAVLNVDEIGISAEFKSIQRDSKKVALKFEAKGDNDKELIDLYAMAGYNVKLFLEPSQMSIDEFYEEDSEPGIEYNVNDGGVVEVAKGQLSADDIPFGEADDVAADDDELLD